MPTLIVTLPASLPSATTLCSTVLTDNDSTTILRHGQTPLSLFPEVNGGEIVAVVPAAQLSWHQLDLPKGTLDRGLFQDGNAARLRSVLDGLLEERLLDEPEQLHYAIEPQTRPGAPVWVAACNRAWLHAWLQALEQAGRPIARIVPELAPSTSETPSTLLQAVGSADAPQLLCAGPNGVAVLPLSAASVVLLGPLLNDSTAADIVAEPAVAALAEGLFSGRVRIETEAQRALRSAQSSSDLAQFDLLRTRRARTQKSLSNWTHALWRAPQWKPARWVVAALVAVNLLGLQAWAWKEQASLVAKKASIREVLTTTFPDVRVVVDAPLQMERALAGLQRQSGAASSADLEEMLGRFQALAPELPAPTAIEFIAGELRLKIPAALDDQLPGVATRLKSSGYAVQLRDDMLMIKQDQRP
ncbi:MAG: general secretion pathway protein GspL [Burkholderiales bacterium]|nr:general secretion pathway protein GspL [Burkholderiales bacterium]